MFARRRYQMYVVPYAYCYLFREFFIIKFEAAFVQSFNMAITNLLEHFESQS